MDLAIQATGGLMSVTGEKEGTPGSEPQKVGVAVADLFTGLYATTAILAALRSEFPHVYGFVLDRAVQLFNRKGIAATPFADIAEDASDRAAPLVASLERALEDLPERGDEPSGDLKITAPAIYNYFPRRDDLITALILDAFNELADAVEKRETDLRIAKVYVSILGDEAMHWAILRQALGEAPVPGAFMS